jgi:hypothetical protein
MVKSAVISLGAEMAPLIYIVLNQLQLFAKLLNGACIAYASKDRDINAKHHPWLSHTTANVLKLNSKTMENHR